MYDKDQAPFLNAVAKIETEKSPEALFGISRNTEIALKKNTPHKYGPRTIDLDLLLYGDHVQETPKLTVPHPRMHERRFVLEPLCELIETEETHPLLHISWKELFANTCEQRCKKVDISL